MLHKIIGQPLERRESAANLRGSMYYVYIDISFSDFMICSEPQHVLAVTLKRCISVFVTVSKPYGKQGEKVNNGIITHKVNQTWK